MTERCHRGPGTGPGLTGPAVVGRKVELSGQSLHLEQIGDQRERI